MVEAIVQIIHDDWSKARRRGATGGLSSSFRIIGALNSFYLRLKNSDYLEMIKEMKVEQIAEVLKSNDNQMWINVIK